MASYLSSLQGKIFGMCLLACLLFSGVLFVYSRNRDGIAQATSAGLNVNKETSEESQHFYKAMNLYGMLPEKSDGEMILPSGFRELLGELKTHTASTGDRNFGDILSKIEQATSNTKSPDVYVRYREEVAMALVAEARKLAITTRSDQNNARNQMKLAIDLTERNYSIIMGICILGIIAMLVVSALMIQTTVTRMKILVKEQTQLVKAVREGRADLSKIEYVEEKDEMSELRNTFMALREGYSELITKIRDVGTHMEEMIQEDLKHFSELAAATEEMGTTARSIASTALNISDAAQNTAQSSKDGRGILETTARELAEAADRVRQGVSRMESLANKVREVDGVVQLIRNIASQTNLLALNAAIEASRAGDAGKGFAVVAEEVRKLALQTSKSAENVISLVQGIQDETKEAVKLIQLIEAESTTAAYGANSSQVTFEKISENSSDLASQIHGIAAATEEQRATVETMGRRIAELFQNVEQSLRPQLKELVHTVDGFKVETRISAGGGIPDRDA